jgi:hypothetical protein
MAYVWQDHSLLDCPLQMKTSPNRTSVRVAPSPAEPLKVSVYALVEAAVAGSAWRQVPSAPAFELRVMPLEVVVTVAPAVVSASGVPPDPDHGHGLRASCLVSCNLQHTTLQLQLATCKGRGKL